MRVATWNVESIRAHEGQVLDWVERHDIDLICMQETRADQRKFPRAGFDTLGYQVTIHGGESGVGGVAIASRIPIVDIDLGIPGAVPPLDEPRSISFTADGIRVHTCYAPNGRKTGTLHHDIKLAWFSLFTSWISLDTSPGDSADVEKATGVEAPDNRDETPAGLLVIGDLNIAPTDLDIWDASRYRKRNLTSPAERLAFERLLGDVGLVDSVRMRLEEAHGFTWWNRRSNFYETDRGWRLDHVLASPATDARITELRIDRAERGRDGSTDHAPILIVLA